MKKAIIIALPILVGLGLIIGLKLVSRENVQTISPASDLSGGDSRSVSDKQVSRALATIQRHQSSPDGYNLLASAYLQKARETGDFSLNSRAESAIARSLELAPDNFDAYSLRAVLLLNYHRFSEALSAALRAQSLRPGVPYVYGAIADALVELGEYGRAVEAAQTMVDTRPDTASYSRISHLRSLYGDTDGAIEVMTDAVKSAGSAENAGWCRIHLGVELINAGRLADAEREFDLALQDMPGYYAALAAKARARAIAGDYPAAIELYRESKERVPQPDTIIALGDLYSSLGRLDDAKREYDLLGLVERASDSQTYRRQLALFWADHEIRLDEALDTARQERAARSDIYSSDLLAWCLFKKNRIEEAGRSADEALSLGAHDARIFYHSGMIYAALGNSVRAIRSLKLALKYRVSFDNSISSFGPLQERDAREALERLATVTKSP
jgi:tetratricopeptide (TPR) repeat protein